MTLTTNLGLTCRGTELGNHLVHCNDTHLPSDNTLEDALHSWVTSALGQYLLFSSEEAGLPKQEFTWSWGVMNVWDTQKRYCSSIPTPNLVLRPTRPLVSSPSSRTNTSLAWPAKQHTDVRADLAQLKAILYSQRKLPRLQETVILASKYIIK